MHLKRPLIAAAVGVAALMAGCALVTQPLVKPVASAPAQVDAVALERHVRALSATFHPRNYETQANIQAAADYVLAQFLAAGARTAVQEVEADGHGYRNVIARFGPAEGPVLIVGAHYDSFDDTPGADDNASGVAGLLELARLLAATPPAAPVELVAYPLEEPPYFRTGSMGSMRHAGELARQKRDVRLMISLEMIGFYRDEPGSQRYPAGLSMLYPDRGNFIAIVGRFGDFAQMRRMKALFAGASTLPMVSINSPRLVAGVDFSDHASYWRFGMPAVMVTDTAFLRNPNYHATTDTPDTLDYARMALVVQGIFAVASAF